MDRTNDFDFSISQSNLLSGTSSISDISLDNSIKPIGRRKVLHNAIEVFIKNKLTLKGLEDLTKFGNAMPGTSIRLPVTKYSILKEFFECNKFNPRQFFLCKTCSRYSQFQFKEQTKRLCSFCGDDINNNNFFVYIGFETQIQSIVKRNFDAIFQFRNETSKEMNITDCYNSSHHKMLLMSNENLWSLTINTDGAAVRNSNGFSLWPILLICNFLPPNLRFKKQNVIAVSFYYDDKKPNMLNYFEPFAEEFENMQKNGVMINSKKFRFFVTQAALDLPAKCSLQQMVQYNGYSACGYCFHRGTSTSKGVRYDHKQENELRSHKDFVKAMATVQQKSGNICNGVKGISPMIAFEGFDLSKSFVIDYMHAVLLGTVKSTLNLWLDSKWHKMQFYIKNNRKLLLNLRLAKLKPCRFITRRPRSLDKIKLFKASEFRNLLLYYLPVCLDGIQMNKYTDHFKLLSSSIFILLKSSISRSELVEARLKLKTFVADFQRFYGSENMTMNIHLLEHICDCVEEFGPLWSYSMFVFENYNGELKEYVVANTDVLHQITTRYILEHSLAEKEQVHMRKNTLSQEKTINLSDVEFYAIQQIVHIQNKNLCTVYTACQRGPERLTSKHYENAKYTIDYFLTSLNEKLGKIVFYIVSDNEEYALLEEYSIVEACDQIKKVKCADKFSIIRVSLLSEKLIYMQVNRDEFVVSRPNRFERD